MTTDLRSQKVKSAASLTAHHQLQSMPVEVCWVMSMAEWKQFRLRGSLMFVGKRDLQNVGEAIRQIYRTVYQQLTPSIKQSFKSEESPGDLLLHHSYPAASASASAAVSSGDGEISENYALCLFRASRVEMLDLRASERLEWTLDCNDSSQWSSSIQLVP
jgi:hypothetical protein